MSAGGSPYLHHAEYWVPPARPLAPAQQASEYPIRQGDLLEAVRVGAERWDAALIVHPTCELGKASVTQIQVARVRLLEEVTDERQRRQVVAGLAEAGGVVRVAFAHTFFVAPVPGSAFDEPMWADLRAIASVPREQVTVDRRIAALTHDARVTFIRRYIYFRFRLALSFDQVRALESARITADPTFPGPKPHWVA